MIWSMHMIYRVVHVCSMMFIGPLKGEGKQHEANSHWFFPQVWLAEDSGLYYLEGFIATVRYIIIVYLFSKGIEVK